MEIEEIEMENGMEELACSLENLLAGKLAGRIQVGWWSTKLGTSWET